MIRPKVPDESHQGKWSGVTRALFALGDAAIGAWLWYALQRFTDHAPAPWTGGLAAAIAVAVAAAAFQTHLRSPGRPWVLCLKFLGMAVALAGLGLEDPSGAHLHLARGQIVWLSAAAAALSWLQRTVYFGTLRSHSDQPLEVLRWILVGAAATLAMAPFYYNGAIGAGDAHWYTVMLGDFVTQLRSGVFPVWVGQSVYAFNGAVSPLRYAPGFQYAGGILDILTARSLEVTALRNAELAVVAIVGAYTAYACLRPILRSAPWTACTLSILWITGPGILAPVMVGDQFMTFMTLPFAPMALHGCWRLWEFGDRWSRLWIAAGLAGLWLFHSPIALWFTIIAACMYAVVFARGIRGQRELRLAMFCALVFLALGSEPFVSVLTLDNQVNDHALGSAAAEAVTANFPGTLMPLDPVKPTLHDYQLGYALSGLLLLSLALLCRPRRRGAWAFAAASVLIIPFVLPVPWLTKAIWTGVPVWFVTIQNIWPMQRLFLVWSTLVVFLAAIMIGALGRSLGRVSQAALAAFLVCAIGWSGREAYRMEMRVFPLRASPAETKLIDGPDNLQLSRYAYSSYTYSPSYFSHAFMDPWFENRLLDSHSMEPIQSNADAAGPESSKPAVGGSAASLVQSGLWTGKSITKSEYYLLRPEISLEPGKHYALRLEFVQPGVSGTLQMRSKSMFREYMLPDSGSGIAREGPSHAFGSDPENCHVIPIAVNEDGPAVPTCMFVARHYVGESLPFARFWLYTYERDRLPVAVESWTPYRARVNASEASYLETPRMWLKGWSATVDGRPTATMRSPENLVMIPVGVGASRVTLDYHPPIALVAAFWACAASWLALGAAALAQLVLWSGAMTLELGWIRTPGWLRRSLNAAGVPFLCAWRHKVAALSVALAVIALALAMRRRAAEQAELKAVGPIRVEFMRPHGFLGASQPIVTTGRPGAATIVFVRYLDKSHAQIGADVWGTLLQSSPVQMDYGKVQSLVVSDSALFPLKNPKVKALEPSEVARLRNDVTVELNGAVVIKGSAYAYETTPDQVLVGRTPFGSITDRTFTGEILGDQRLAVPRTLALPAGRHLHMRVTFPLGRTGRSEPILSVASGSQIRVCYVSYIAHDKLRMTCWGPGGMQPKSAETEYDPTNAHDLDIMVGQASDDPANFEISCEFDGNHLLGHNCIAAARPPVIESGLNSFGAPGVDARFTGPLMDVELRSHVLIPGEAPETTGPVHLVVTFPPLKPGRSEPLVSTGKTGAGDFIYVTYVDEKRVRIGFDHWGYGGEISAPITVDYAAPHEIWIAMGSLYPSLRDDKAWHGLDPGVRQRLISRVDVIMDGKSVLASETTAHPASPAEVTVARNTIGGSTSDPVFSGAVVFSERAGAVPPPPAAR